MLRYLAPVAALAMVASPVLAQTNDMAAAPAAKTAKPKHVKHVKHHTHMKTAKATKKTS